MPSSKTAAIHYASAGLPVLALHLPDGTEGCSCSNPDCPSPGKHPRTDLCPHGVKDATTNEETIAAWPEDINIGVALGQVAGGVMVFDVDHLEIAARLLAPEVGLSDQTAVATSGRLGAHIWFRSIGSTRTFHLRAKAGEKIGEVRGDGAYVVVPPSLSVTGRRYRWIGQGERVDPAQFHSTDNPQVYVPGLLADVGVVLSESAREGVSGAIPEKYRQMPVTAIEIPKRIRGHALMTNLRQQLAGRGGLKKPEGKADPDRSKRLMGVGYAARDAAKELGQALTLEECAGIVKAAVIGWYGKYDEGRLDTDYRCWEIAWKAFAEAGIGEAGIPQAGQKQYDSDNFFWDPDVGKIYKKIHRANGQMATQEVCNFLPEIMEDIELDSGTAVGAGERVWRVRFLRRGGAQRDLLLRVDDRTRRGGGLEAALAGSLLPSNYIVSARHAPEVRQAMQELSENPLRGKAFAATGWMEEQTVYVLPGADGGLCAEGIDTARRIDQDRLPANANVLRQELSHYGQGVRPPATEGELKSAWGAFASLIAVAPVRVSIPIVLQILAGPLASSGLGAVPPLVHVMGRTGTLKTSYCLAALSLLGTFKEQAPTPWTSTPVFLTDLLNTAKDLTVLVDDYKRSAIKPSKFTELIQNYADRTGRGRGTPDGTARSTPIARGLLLSNGEDKWEGEASVEARTIIVSLGEEDIDLKKLTTVQKTVQRQELQLFGGAYIVWLAQNSALLREGALDTERERWRKRLVDSTGPSSRGIHLRVLSSHASLLAAGSVAVRFVRSVFGKEAGQELTGWIKEAAKHLTTGAIEQAKEIAWASPFRKLAGAIAEAAASRKACLIPVAGLDADHRRYPDIPGEGKADPVGYWEERYGVMFALLTRENTYGWYERIQVQRGERVGFSWAAVLREAIDQFGGERVDRKRVMVGGRVSQLSGILLPLSAVIQEVPKEEKGS